MDPLVMRNIFTKEKITLLSRTLSEYDILMDEFFGSLSGKKPNLHQHTIADLLIRVKINLHSIKALLPSLEDYSPTFFSIGLLNRTIIADFITYCYVTGILSAANQRGLDEKEINSILKNELNILELAYVKAMIAAVELESQLPQHNPKFASVLENKNYSERLPKLKEMYKDLFQDNDINKKFKSTRELRADGSIKIFQPNEIKEDPKESFMHKFSIENGFGAYAHSYLLFRFYSQFQHYSSNSLKLIKPDINDYNFFYLVFTVDYAFILTDMIIQQLDSIKSKYLGQLREITDQLEIVLRQ